MMTATQTRNAHALAKTIQAHNPGASYRDCYSAACGMTADIRRNNNRAADKRAANRARSLVTVDALPVRRRPMAPFFAAAATALTWLAPLALLACS